MKKFLLDFRPCVDAAGELFKNFRPGEWEHGMLYHDHLVRVDPRVGLDSDSEGEGESAMECGSGSEAGSRTVSPDVGDGTGNVSRGPVSDGNYRTPFASMKISVNTTTSPRRLGSSLHDGTWTVVVLLGAFMGDDVTFMGGGPGGDSRLKSVEG